MWTIYEHYPEALAKLSRSFLTTYERKYMAHIDLTPV
jgi:hypothetical protein